MPVPDGHSDLLADWAAALHSSSTCGLDLMLEV